MTVHEWMPIWLARLWEVPGATDVLLNGPGDVWIDRGLGLERAESIIPDAVLPATAADLRALAVRLASGAGRRLDDACPMVDARLPDGTRMHAVLPPIAHGSTMVSLRRVRAGRLTWDRLEAQGAVHPELVPVLKGLVTSHASLVISGATGSGKTTLLSTLLAAVDPAERIVLIEEAGELRPEHPHVVSLLERPANVDGAGEVGLARLVREALRMRPDRIVLGECRGPELREILLALNTGHRGSLTTIHANTATDVPARLIALGALAGLDSRAVSLHALTAFDAVIHMDRTPWGRAVSHIALFEPGDDDRSPLTAVSACRVDQAGALVRQKAWDRLCGLAGVGASHAPSATSVGLQVAA